MIAVVAPSALLPLGRRGLLAAVVGALSGCSTTDACDTLCAHAESKFASCLEDQGLEWGTSVGFTSEQDFDDWCATYAWEERQLDDGAQCAARQAIVDCGTCADWYTAWGDEP